MGVPKKYADVDFYERKLRIVMERLAVDDYKYNWDRHGGWVDFQYKGEWYRFEHSVEKAKARGLNLQYGSDAFAQVVRTLEELARMIERGIYELSTWVAGMRFLPPPMDIPDCLRTMGFAEIPAGVDDIRERFRNLAKTMHPDCGGSVEKFKELKEAADTAVRWMTEREGGM